MNFVSRFFGWSTASASLVAMSGTSCPCCGRLMCPQGLALFGIIGGLIGCALRIFARNSTSETPHNLPRNWARHDLALDATKQIFGNPPARHHEN